jgi:hypothetical protein
MDNSGVDTSMHDLHDAAVQDQGMMDSMDDLFGDANDAINVNVNLSLPAVTLPPPPALIKSYSHPAHARESPVSQQNPIAINNNSR